MARSKSAKAASAQENPAKDSTPATRKRFAGAARNAKKNRASDALFSKAPGYVEVGAGPETFLVLKQVDQATQYVSSRGAHFAIFSDRSPNKKTPNEDAALAMVLPDEPTTSTSSSPQTVTDPESRLVLAVADGVGGLKGGAQAAEIVLKTLQEKVISAKHNESFRVDIVDALESANRTILNLPDAGATTVAIVEIYKNTYRTYHVGDSQVVQCSNRGRNKMTTTPHSPVGMAVEAGWIDEAAAMHHHHRHVVNNVVGSAAMRIEIGPTTSLAARDTLLLASDGLFDNLLMQEVLAIIAKGSLNLLMETLAQQSKQRMLQPQAGQASKPDDLTIICYRGF